MLRALDIEYTRFNATRTLLTERPSEFRVERFDGLIALVDPARRRPGYPNRILGLTPESLPALESALVAYEGEDLVPEIQISSHPTVEARLVELGFHPLHTLAYLLREPVPVPVPGLIVERWGPERAGDFLELLRHAGVVLTDGLRALRREHYCTERFRAHVAHVNGVPSAWATLFVWEKLGFFANAFTVETARSRGCQTALLAARLRDAHDLGLETVVTDLVCDSPSHRNVERAGFRLERVETVWQRPLPP
jgi:GNAT superfamily N-acetyltransferase